MKIEKYKKNNGATAYRFRVYVGYQNGKRHYIRRSGFKTKGEARTALLLLQEEIDNKTHLKIPNFGQVAKNWLDDYYDTVQESTYIKTSRMLNKHIMPILADKELDDITPLLLQEQLKIWTKQLVHGRKLKGIVSNIFKYAIRHDYIKTNPTESLSLPPRKEIPKTKDDFYNKDQLKTFLQLLEQTNDPEKICLFRLLAFTGVRIGELLALSWDDWDNNTLTINKAVTRSLGGLEIGQPKTKASNRLISLDPKTQEILSTYKATTNSQGLIFHSENGGFMTTSLPRKWLRQIIQGSDLHPIKIHGFRHTHASLCFEAGMTLKQVQYRLGHSDLKTTMNVYTHITTQAKDDIGERFSNYIDF